MPPLKVTFTSITGDDIDTDPVTGICPPQTAAQASLVEELLGIGTAKVGETPFEEICRMIQRLIDH